MTARFAVCFSSVLDCAFGLNGAAHRGGCGRIACFANWLAEIHSDAAHRWTHVDLGVRLRRKPDAIGGIAACNKRFGHIIQPSHGQPYSATAFPLRVDFGHKVDPFRLATRRLVANPADQQTCLL